jgi:hypothetical protein
VLVAGILRDIDGAGWHWKLMDVVKPPRRERWTLHGMAATEDEARKPVEATGLPRRRSVIPCPPGMRHLSDAGPRLFRRRAADYRRPLTGPANQLRQEVRKGARSCVVSEV